MGLTLCNPMFMHRLIYLFIYRCIFHVGVFFSCTRTRASMWFFLHPFYRNYFSMFVCSVNGTMQPHNIYTLQTWLFTAKNVMNIFFPILISLVVVVVFFFFFVVIFFYPDELNNEIYTTLSTYDDGWFHFNCNRSVAGLRPFII